MIFFFQRLKFHNFLQLWEVSVNSCQETTVQVMRAWQGRIPIGYSHVFSVYAASLRRWKKRKRPLWNTKIFWKLMFHMKSLNYFQDFLEVFWGVCFLAFSLENEAPFLSFLADSLISDLKFWHSSTYLPPKEKIFPCIYRAYYCASIILCIMV